MEWCGRRYGECQDNEAQSISLSGFILKGEVRLSNTKPRIKHEGTENKCSVKIEKYCELE